MTTFEREPNEHYVEPAWCSKRLFEVEKFGSTIWDPCCGFGTIPDEATIAGYDIFATDLVDRGYENLDGVADLYDARVSVDVPDVVCNPPFKSIGQFTLQVVLRPSTKKAALICPVARLNAAHPWLQTLPLIRIWLLTPRPSMPPGHVIAAGEKPGGGKMDYCWIVFERGFKGKPTVDWLKRDG